MSALLPTQNKPHMADVILAPKERIDPESVLFDIPLRAQYGKVIVCMVPKEEKWGSIWLTEEVSGKYQPDFGVVYDPAGTDLERGDIVALKPYCGVWYVRDPMDPWTMFIPENREMRILGTVDEWSDNILGILEYNDVDGTQPV